MLLFCLSRWLLFSAYLYMALLNCDGKKNLSMSVVMMYLIKLRGRVSLEVILCRNLIL
uniref:Uncharacterized protein n=1 Tax=Arundo donax TaxID=35708 RepID=A0A0A9E4R6_ARUDO